MDVDEVTRRIQAIREKAGDYEAQHALQDALYVDVLYAIAYGTCENAPTVAAVALTVEEMDFPRWCA